MRQIGPVEFKVDYLQKVMQNEFGTIFFYLLLSVGFTMATPVVWLPVSIFYLIGSAEFIKRSTFAPLKNAKIQEFANLVSSKKNDIKIARGYIELFSVFYYLILVAMGHFSIITLFIVGHYVKIKYKLNQYNLYAINTTRDFALEKAGNIPVAGGLAKKAVSGVFWLFTV